MTKEDTNYAECVDHLVNSMKRQSLKPHEMNDRQFLGWNMQTRLQLVEDLYYTCRQDNGGILETILDEYVYLLKDNTERLDELKSWTDETLGTDD